MNSSASDQARDGLLESWRPVSSVNRHASRSERVRQWRILGGSLVLLDAAVIALSFLIAFELRFRSEIRVFQLEVAGNEAYYQRVSVIAGLVWLVAMAALGLYSRKNLLGGTREYSLVFRATTIGLVSVIFFEFLNIDFVLARGWLITAWLTSALLLTFGRFAVRRIAYLLRTHGYLLAPTIIVGANIEGRSLGSQLSNFPRSGLRVLGYVDDELPAGTHLGGGLHVLGGLHMLDTIAEENEIEELIITTSAMSRPEIEDLFRRFGRNENINFRMSTGLFEIITTGLEVIETSHVPLVSISKMRLRGFDLLSKHMLDFLIAIPALVFLSPVLLVIAIAVRLNSSGPTLHRREVMGLNGTRFIALKFRTMLENSDGLLDTHPELRSTLADQGKLVNDPRVTSLGRLLRRWSLDELPQLVNVVRREMSIVGPRMISPSELPAYRQWGINLLTVRPGVTGSWQVSGRSNVGYEERVRLDMNYIRNWTVWLDLQILVQTIPAVLSGRGAY